MPFVPRRNPELVHLIFMVLMVCVGAASSYIGFFYAGWTGVLWSALPYAAGWLHRELLA